MRYSIIQHNDLLLAQHHRQNDVLETTLLSTDWQRSVLQTLTTNHQRQPIAYSPYGHRAAGNGLTSLLGFNGERSDPVTGQYLLGNGYRAFNPLLMRFNCPDSLSPFGEGGLNTYAYCQGDPVNLNDPSGRATGSVFRLLVVRPVHRTGPNMAQIPVAQDTPPPPLRPVTQRIASRPPVTNALSDEYSRVIDTRQPSPDVPMNAAMRVALRNAVEPPRTEPARSTRMEDVIQPAAVSNYSNTGVVGIAGLPTTTQLDVRSLVFDIRRRSHHQGEAAPLRGNRPLP
ncbi:hypothetical protein D3C86_1450070 [compost metagenome]